MDTTPLPDHVELVPGDGGWIEAYLINAAGTQRVAVLGMWCNTDGWVNDGPGGNERDVADHDTWLAGVVRLGQRLDKPARRTPDPIEAEVMPAAEAVATTPAPTVHHVNRHAVPTGGFVDAEGGRYVDRVGRGPRKARLLVDGAHRAGFGLCYCDTDLWSNTGEFRPRRHGARLDAYGLGTVIDNHGGTAAEIARDRADGVVIEAVAGDLLVMPDPAAPAGATAWRIEAAGYDGRDVRLVPANDEYAALIAGR